MRWGWTLVLLLVATPLAADERELLERVRALEFLTGNWEGYGEHRHADGRTSRFYQSIQTRARADRHAILSMQKAVSADDPEQTIFEAFVVYTYDVNPGEYVSIVLPVDGEERVERFQLRGTTLTWVDSRNGEQFELRAPAFSKMIMTAISGETGEEVFHAEFYRVNE